MKLISKDISYGSLETMPVLDQNKVLIQYAKMGEALKGDREDFSEAGKVAGKLVCLLGARLERAIAANTAPANRTVKEEYKSITGSAPTSHAYAFSKVFGGLVLTGKLPESVYDDNPGNPLTITGQIQNAVLDLPEGNNLNHPAIAAACAELARPTGKEKATLLRAILSTVKPAAKLTDEEVIEMIEEIAKDGKLGLALIQAADEFGDLKPEDQKPIFGTFHGTDGVVERISKFAGANETAWMDELRPAINVIRKPAAETPVSQTGPFADAKKELAAA